MESLQMYNPLTYCIVEGSSDNGRHSERLWKPEEEAVEQIWRQCLYVAGKN